MNLKDFQIRIEYKIGKHFFARETENEHFTLSVSEDSTENHLKLSIIPRQPMQLVNFDIRYEKYPFSENAAAFVNGYQSWTTSREYRASDKQLGLRGPGKVNPVRLFAATTGDYNFKSYSKEAGVFHGLTYGYVRTGENVNLIGSLSDRSGWTVINFDMVRHRIIIEKDVEGLTIDKEYQLYDIVSLNGGYDEVFDEYFDLMDVKKPKVDHLAGYTSWYNYMQKIDENIIKRDLRGLSRAGKQADIFQIDDGWETMIGDWKSVDPIKFPNGLKPIVDEIHERGYLAGLWLAPFSAQSNMVNPFQIGKKAQVIKDHPEWIIRNKKGRKIVGGFAWNGFYALDFYIPECAAYIKSCFDNVFDNWGFDMVKLDFLYSVCIEPRYNKTRGQIMYEAMDFLRDCCRDKYILGCGVPLAPCFGVVDFCRISCDAEFSFKEKFYTKCTNQEVISTRNAINNSVFRRHLDGRAFVNDPDVFFLREDNAKYNLEQKLLLAKINHMFGNILFVSDNIADYDDEMLKVLLDSYKKFDGKIITAEYIDSTVLKVIYEEEGKKFKLVFDIVTGEYSYKEI